MTTYTTPNRPDPCIRHEIIGHVDQRYQEMVTSKRGGVLFVAASEPGMGRQATLKALAEHFQQTYQKMYLLGGRIDRDQFQPWQKLPANKTTLGLAQQLLGLGGDAAVKDTLGNVMALVGAAVGSINPMLGFIAQLLQTVASAQSLTHDLIAKNQLGDVRPDPNDLRKLLRRAAINRPVVCIFDRFDHFDPGWWSAFFMSFAGELQYSQILFVVRLTGDAKPPDLEAESRENYKTLPLIAASLQRQGWGEWHYLSHYTPEQVAAWIGVADPTLPQRLYRATSGQPHHMRELWAEWQLHNLLFANTDDLVWRLQWQPNNDQLGEVGELLDERITSLFPDLDELQRQDLQRELAIAALEGEWSSAQPLAQILGEDEDDWIDLLDERLIFSGENPHGLFEAAEGITIQDSAKQPPPHLWRYRFVSDLHCRALVALRLNDSQREEASLALAEALLEWYAPQTSLIAESLDALFTRAGERDKAATYRQLIKQPSSPLIANATRHALTTLPYPEYEEWQQLIYAWLLLQEGKQTLLRIPYAESEAIFRQVVEIARNLKDREYLAEGLSYQGWMMAAGGNPQPALSLLQESLQLYKQLNDERGEADTLNNLGSVYSDLGDKQKALGYYEQALPLLRQVGDKGSEAAAIAHIGAVYSDLGDKAKALDYFEQALPLQRQVGDKGGEAATLTCIGDVYSALGDKQKALDYYEQALPLRHQVGHKGGEAVTLTCIGDVYSALGDKQKALGYFEQALSLHQQVGDKGGEATTLNNIGSVYSDLGDKAKALAYFEQALPLRRQVGDRWGEKVTGYNIGMVYESLGDLPRTIEQLEQVVAIDEALGHPDLEKDRAELARLREKLQRIRTATD